MEQLRNKGSRQDIQYRQTRNIEYMLYTYCGNTIRVDGPKKIG